MSKTPEILVPALRQYQHNNGSGGFITGFDYNETFRVVRELEQQLAICKRTTKVWQNRAFSVEQQLEAEVKKMRRALEHIRFYGLDNVPENIRAVARAALLQDEKG